MTRPLGACAVLLACALFAGCATSKKATTATVPASQVQVYNTTQLVPDQYTIVDHIWIDSWRSNISIPTYATADAGVEALKQKAADAGANGLLNVICLDATGYANGRLLCYGDAINFVQAAKAN